MNTAPRVALTALASVATFYLAELIPFALIPLPGPLAWLASLLCAVPVGRYVWRQTEAPSAGLAGSMLLGAAVTGGVGFVAGFFGSMLLAPGANQGPLLGIFITGPLGVVLGALGGGIYWRVRGERGLRRRAPG